ncbi:hypothetical protein BGZ83_002275 [Gryganskiella cystojenkinii]|nr:hypothetical protein BGZ83_002275 [Gryganskiella cystojenkinii]
MAHSTNNKSRNWSSHKPSKASTLIILLAASSISLIANAQQAPVGTRRVGFTVLDDALYIQGGFDVNTSNQFISLDLSTSWPASSPAWSILKDGQSTSHLTLAAISAASNGGSKGSILAIGGMINQGLIPTFFSTYDVNSRQWNNLTSVKPPYNYLEGHATVTDPNTGLVYIIGGYGTNAFNTLSVYDPKGTSMVSQQSSPSSTSLTDVAAVWSSSRNTILTFGGSRAPPAAVQGLGTSDLNEYDPNSKQWKTMSTSGDVPSARLDHCMASSEDGSKVVLFGGTVDGNTYFSDIYVLDVASGKWKQGQSASVPRTRMACAFHSYQFVAWGGSSAGSRTTMLNNVPIVYSLNQGKWVDNYNAAEVPAKSNTGAIVGGIVAILAIGGAIGFFVIRRKRQRKAAKETYHSDTIAAAGVSGENGHEHGGYEDDNIKVLASPSMEYQHRVDHYGNYAGNDYPLSNIDLSSGTGSGYHLYNGSSPAIVSGSPMNRYAGIAVTPRIQSPPVAYSVSSPAAAMSVTSPYHGSQYYPGGVSAGSQSPAPGSNSNGSANPFNSPEDYYHPPPTIASSIAPSSPGTNPFMTAATAVSAMAVTTTYQPSAYRDQQDPFQEQRSPYPQPITMMMSPSPGARAPQMIPESSPSMGYVPPPPAAS